MLVIESRGVTGKSCELISLCVCLLSDSAFHELMV